MQLKVNEIFYSLQGEGYFAGTPAVFVRLSGCNRRCAFCDTDFADFRLMTVDDILQAMEQAQLDAGAAPTQTSHGQEKDLSAASAPLQPTAPVRRHAVITGGEPTLQIDEAFVDALHQRGYFVQIETNGSLPAPANIDWVTCSPKDQPWRINRVDELKIVYQGQDVEAILSHFSPKVRCLQPCSGLNIPQTIAYILAHPWWRLSLQTHKLLSIR